MAPAGSPARLRRRGPGWQVLDARPCSVREARAWVTRVIRSAGVPVDVDEAAVVVSELVANAVLHGPEGRRVLVAYCLSPGGARLVVADGGGAAAPWVRCPGPVEEGGRGLQVVAAFTVAWGHFRLGPARVVWCDLGESLGSPAAPDAWAWLLPVLAGAGLHD
jgi:anti-sigma regulatory factor (Ser/Thr protein kinase)